jgi:predicted anti-sigma-YlaC factor YlaD
MDCTQSIELLSDFHDGVLEEPLYVEVETHLRICHPCAGIFRDLDTIVLAAMTLRSEEPGTAYPDEQDIWNRLSIGKDTLH